MLPNEIFNLIVAQDDDGGNWHSLIFILVFMAMSAISSFFKKKQEDKKNNSAKRPTLQRSEQAPKSQGTGKPKPKPSFRSPQQQSKPIPRSRPAASEPVTVKPTPRQHPRPAVPQKIQQPTARKVQPIPRSTTAQILTRDQFASTQEAKELKNITLANEVNETQSSSPLQNILKNQPILAQAIILSEVIGQPVAMREQK